MTIGAAVRHSAIDRSARLTASAPAFVGAMPYIGHRAIGNRGTVCGSLAHADPMCRIRAPRNRGMMPVARA